MIRSLCLLALLAGAGCADPAPDATPAPERPAEPAPPAPGPGAAGGAPADTLALDAEAPSLAGRPRAPLRIDGACPFEGCQYGTWTTTGETTVYAAPTTTSATFTVPAETALDADRGFVLLTALGQAVARRETRVYLSFEDTRPVAAGDTLLVFDTEGEGSYRVWSGGVFAFSDEVLAEGGPPGVEPAFRVLRAPSAAWWAHVTLPDGRSGWLWMDETPSVRGADALG